MRQVGIFAAAGLWALDHNVERLAEDHANARAIAARLAQSPAYVIDPATVDTNILVWHVADGFPEAPTIDVFFASEPGAPRELVPRWLAELRELGLACDTDYAGRSIKGQLTQAARLGAVATVVVGPERATIRRAGAPDEEVGHGEVSRRLSP